VAKILVHLATGPVELGPPERLVESSLWADRTFAY
jgi:hypothetical protein